MRAFFVNMTAVSSSLRTARTFIGTLFVNMPLGDNLLAEVTLSVNIIVKWFILVFHKWWRSCWCFFSLWCRRECLLWLFDVDEESDKTWMTQCSLSLSLSMSGKFNLFFCHVKKCNLCMLCAYVHVCGPLSAFSCTMSPMNLWRRGSCPVFSGTSHVTLQIHISKTSVLRKIGIVWMFGQQWHQAKHQMKMNNINDVALIDTHALMIYHPLGDLVH